MNIRIWIDSENVKNMDAESFDTSMISSEFLTGEYQLDIMVEGQIREPKPETINETEFSKFLGLNPVVPADDGYSTIWSGYWSKEDGFTIREEAEHKTIEYLFG